VVEALCYNQKFAGSCLNEVDFFKLKFVTSVSLMSNLRVNVYIPRPSIRLHSIVLNETQGQIYLYDMTYYPDEDHEL
jgi:hypothetical protein